MLLNWEIGSLLVVPDSESDNTAFELTEEESSGQFRGETKDYSVVYGSYRVFPQGRL